MPAPRFFELEDATDFGFQPPSYFIEEGFKWCHAVWSEPLYSEEIFTTPVGSEQIKTRTVLLRVEVRMKFEPFRSSSASARYFLTQETASCKRYRRPSGVLRPEQLPENLKEWYGDGCG